MEKLLKMRSAKILVGIVWMLSLIGIAVAGVGMLFQYEWSDHQQMQSAYGNMTENLADNLSAAVLQTIVEENTNQISHRLDELGENFDYAVIEGTNDDSWKEDVQDRQTYLYASDGFNGSYLNYFEGGNCGSYYFQTSSTLGMAWNDAWYDGYDDRNGYVDPSVRTESEDAMLSTEAESGTEWSTEPGLTESDSIVVYRVFYQPLPEIEAGSARAELEHMFGWIRDGADLFALLLVVGVSMFLLSTLFLIWSAGHRMGREQVSLCGLDKIPLGVLMAGTWCMEIAICCVIASIGTGYAYLNIRTMIGLIVLMLFVAGTVFLPFAMSVVTRLKCHCFWRYTLLYYGWKPFGCVLRWFRDSIRKLYENLSLSWKVVLCVIGVDLLLLCSTMLVIEIFQSEGLLVLWIAWCVVIQIVFACLFAIQLTQLKEGGERIAAGDLRTPIDTDGMFWEFKRHGENLNKARAGIQLAVQERMKSEHFRTELITNVSHDIKTPLTSIINYVDLMKKEDIQDETVLSYMEVLDRQSARLKKLIEDLMEVSKASTGNLSVNLERCDVAVLFTQLIGEYEDRAAEHELSFVCSRPKNPVPILADSRHLWRVFDNLLNNICKYAMPGTRVYVELLVEPGSEGAVSETGGQAEGSQAVIIFKNISCSPLNISSEELMERFVRGDSSRNTEGSGLGLSIAQSLMELMHGKLSLAIDGDLFKVTLRFPIVR